MYCNKCERYFDEDDLVWYTEGYIGMGSDHYYKECYCPHCGSSDVDDAIEEDEIDVYSEDLSE